MSSLSNYLDGWVNIQLIQIIHCTTSHSFREGNVVADAMVDPTTDLALIRIKY